MIIYRIKNFYQHMKAGKNIVHIQQQVEEVFII